MARGLPRFPELSGFNALVPVPLHPRRARERGYNQARLIAEAISAACGAPVLDILERRRHTRPQSSLNRGQRLENISAAISAREQASGIRALIVDDVCTTSASLEACAKALRGAGSEDVRAYVFARQEA